MVKESTDDGARQHNQSMRETAVKLAVQVLLSQRKSFTAMDAITEAKKISAYVFGVGCREGHE